MGCFCDESEKLYVKLNFGFNRFYLRRKSNEKFVDNRETDM